jgi:hypothetical protein
MWTLNQTKNMLRYERDIVDFALKLQNCIPSDENVQIHVTLTKPLYEKILLRNNGVIAVEAINKMTYIEKNTQIRFILEYEKEEEI